MVNFMQSVTFGPLECTFSLDFNFTMLVKA